MVSCYFGCRSTMCYLLLREALSQGISFVAIAVLNIYTNGPLSHHHRGRGLPSCRLGLFREDSTFLEVSCDIWNDPKLSIVHIRCEHFS